MELGLEARALPADGRIPLAADEAHVWLAPLDDAGKLAADGIATLSEDEKERARGMAAEVAERFVAARVLLRRVLSAYLSLSPDRVEIACGPHGKPLLASAPSGAEIHFNLSHSANTAAFAVAKTPLGVDIEGIRRISDPDALAARVLARSEIETLHQVPAEQRDRRLLEVWTCKEAYLKALGGGISHGLANFEVEVGDHGEAAVQRVNEPRDPEWTFRQLPLGSGLAGAVAIRVPECSVRCWRLA